MCKQLHLPTINAGDRDAALDLVQDAFAKKFGSTVLKLNLAKTYLFTTVNNLFLNTIKHQSGFGLCQRNTTDRTNQSQNIF
jgi:RNA polymerase sigma-70 factor (ECF subfamily)